MRDRVKLSVSIMAHVSRDGYVEKLRRRLGDVPVAWDRLPASKDTEQRWANGRRAWEMADDTADFHLVLQDDALVARNLVAGLERALCQLPPRMTMSPYYGNRARPQRRRGETLRLIERNYASWIQARRMVWGVAMVAPTDTIEGMVNWCQYKVGQNYDFRVGSYYKNVLHWPCWYLYPSLVDHRRGPSLLGHAPGRFVEAFHSGDACDIDVEGPVVNVERVKQVWSIREVWAQNGDVRVG